jgi:hypothetical protein
VSIACADARTCNSADIAVPLTSSLRIGHRL